MAAGFILLKIIPDRADADTDVAASDFASDIVLEEDGSMEDLTNPYGKGEVDGGVTDSSDFDAPKSIESSEITYFEVRFSTVDRVECSFGYDMWSLKAELSGDKVSCEVRVMRDENGTQTFEADAGFMEELYRIVDECNLASYNGHSYHVSGLPEEFGADIDIEFASGEKIYASDNQENFLTDEAMERMLELFGADLKN